MLASLGCQASVAQSTACNQIAGVAEDAPPAPTASPSAAHVNHGTRPSDVPPPLEACLHNGSYSNYYTLKGRAEAFLELEHAHGAEVRVFTQYNGPFPVQVEIDVPSNYDEIAAYEAQMAQAQTWKETH
ncbi:MAG: hypothetical protein M3022_12350, partial [Actinomycetota bacterium]|nr:hypothetical protein [Actinomycetota bacterium]